MSFFGVFFGGGWGGWVRPPYPAGMDVTGARGKHTYQNHAQWRPLLPGLKPGRWGHWPQESKSAAWSLVTYMSIRLEIFSHARNAWDFLSLVGFTQGNHNIFISIDLQNCSPWNNSTSILFGLLEECDGPSWVTNQRALSTWSLP